MPSKSKQQPSASTAVRQQYGKLQRTATGLIKSVKSYVFWLLLLLNTVALAVIGIFSPSKRHGSWAAYLLEIAIAIFTAFTASLFFWKFVENELKKLDGLLGIPQGSLERAIARCAGEMQWSEGNNSRPDYVQQFQECFEPSDGRNEEYYFFGRSGDVSVARLVRSKSNNRPKTSWFVLSNPWDESHMNASYAFSVAHGTKSGNKELYILTKRLEICKTVERLYNLRTSDESCVFHVYLSSDPLYSRMEVLDTGVFTEDYDSGKKWGDRFFFPKDSNAYKFRRDIVKSLTKAGDERAAGKTAQQLLDEVRQMTGCVRFFSSDTNAADFKTFMEAFPCDKLACKKSCWVKELSNLPSA